MSLIDYFKHKPIAEFMNSPVYLPLENFDYREYGLVCMEDIIWRDDHNSIPVIISIRACVAEAIQVAIYAAMEKGEKLFTTKEILEPGEHEKIKNIETWREASNYSTGYYFYEQYLKLVPEEDVGNFECWAKEQLGLLIIRFYPELLTNLEIEQVQRLKMQECKEYPMAMKEPYIYPDQIEE